MGMQIIKQPDELYCVFCSITDRFLVQDATEEEVVGFFKAYAAERAEFDVKFMFQQMKDGKNPYPFKTDYNYALKRHKRKPNIP